MSLESAGACFSVNKPQGAHTIHCHSHKGNLETPLNLVGFFGLWEQHMENIQTPPFINPSCRPQAPAWGCYWSLNYRWSKPSSKIFYTQIQSKVWQKFSWKQRLCCCHRVLSDIYSISCFTATQILRFIIRVKQESEALEQMATQKQNLRFWWV